MAVPARQSRASKFLSRQRQCGCSPQTKNQRNKKTASLKEALEVSIDYVSLALEEHIIVDQAEKPNRK
jgi:hypothetical protein